MTIIEAVKSGKRFKRPCYANWHDPKPAYGNLNIIFNITEEDIIADDWETEEEKIEVTKDQLGKAWDKALSVPADRNVLVFNHINNINGDRFIHFLKELGFKNEGEK